MQSCEPALRPAQDGGEGGGRELPFQRRLQKGARLGGIELQVGGTQLAEQPLRPQPRERQEGIGARGEDAAADRYGRAGFHLVARNWRCRLGEIDLVLARGSLLVICEVKARRGAGLGGPFEAVTPRKQEKLRRLAQAFLVAESRSLRRIRVRDVRFDVASVTIDGAAPRVHLYEDAF